jgi:hypothetical protein
MARGHQVAGRWLGAGLAALAAFVVAGAQVRDRTDPATTASARVHGRVVVADTGAPLRGVSVQVSAVPLPPRSVLTDQDGRFDFSALPARELLVMVRKGGFIDAPIVTVTPRAAATLDVGDIRLARGSAIAGRLLDEFGEPVEAATVTGHRVTFPAPGSPKLAAERSAVTNDLGEYRLFGLRPGYYYVSARPTPAGAAAPTFFPGTAIQAEAQVVSVQSGGQVLGTDFRRLRLPVTRLSGQLTDSSGDAATDVMLLLRQVTSDGALHPYGKAEADAEGRFMFASISPGEYRLEAVALASMAAISARAAGGRAPGRVVPEFASAPAHVVAGDNDIQVQTIPGYALRGRILIDGAPPAAGTAGGLTIAAAPPYSLALDPGGMFAASAAVAEDGQFMLTGRVGRQMLSVDGLRSGSIVSRIVVAGADVTDDGVDVSRGAVSDVEVHVSTALTVVKGHVTDTGGALRDADVVVFAADPRLWGRPSGRHLVRTRTKGAEGFTLAGLPAGRYFAVAVARLDLDQWADPDGLHLLRPHATPFTLTDGEAKTLALVAVR